MGNVGSLPDDVKDRCTFVVTFSSIFFKESYIHHDLSF